MNDPGVPRSTILWLAQWERAKVITCRSASGDLTISRPTGNPPRPSRPEGWSAWNSSRPPEAPCEFWCTTAVVGSAHRLRAVRGVPPGYQASTSLLLTPGPYENIMTAANNESGHGAEPLGGRARRAPAGAAGKRRQLPARRTRFAPITERLIVITASARSSNQAVLDASAVATAFLKFRAEEMQTRAEAGARVAQPAGQAGPAASQLDQRADQSAVGPARVIRTAVAAQEPAGGASPGENDAVQLQQAVIGTRQPTVRPPRRR